MPRRKWLETVKYQCGQFDFVGDSLAVIIEHVILSHKKDKGGKFECEGCPIVVDTRRELVEHYNNEHLRDSDPITIEPDPEENVMIEQYRLLKSSFERLSIMLKATQEEAAQTKMDLAHAGLFYSNVSKKTTSMPHSRMNLRGTNRAVLQLSASRT